MSAERSPFEILSSYMLSLVKDAPIGGVYSWMADTIIAYPDLHIDALVEAGVLKPLHMNCDSKGQFLLDDGTVTAHGEAAYCIARPSHKHNWVVATSARFGDVTLGCLACDETRTARNCLPIEVPE